MSRMHALGLTLAVAAAVCWPPPAIQAQQTEAPGVQERDTRPTEEELVSRIEALWPQLEQARVEALEAEARWQAAQAAAHPSSLDTIQVGPLTVVTLPSQVQRAREWYGRVWEQEFTPFMEHTPSLDRVMFTFHWDAGPGSETIPMRGTHFRSEARAWRGRGYVEELIRENVGRAIAYDLEGTQLHGWVREAVRAPNDWDWVYRRLAMTPSQIARSCIDGETGACWTALGIGATAEALMDWYTPEERRVLVRRQLDRYRYRREEEPRLAACVDDGVLEVCDALLREAVERSGDNALRWQGSLAPLGSEERATMVWTALEVGGEGAWGRLMEDPEMTVAEALLHASGVTAEELETAWRAQVLDHAPQTHADLATTKWTALFWILLLGALAMRSTRWRLG